MTPFSERRPDDATIQWLGHADPLEVGTASGWARSPEAAAVIRKILEAEGPPVESVTAPRARRARPLMLAAALLIVGAGVAGAGALLGRPAPEGVRHDLAGVDQGMPADLRFDPDTRNARLVASADGAQLYAAALAVGGACTEIVDLDGRPAGAVCARQSELDAMPISVTVPFVDPITFDSPIVVGGRVNAPGATSLESVYEDGVRQALTLEAGGYYVFAVPADHLTSAHRHGFALVAWGADGTQLATANVPATDFADPEVRDAKEPIFVSTISTHRDYTLVLGIEGSVNVSGARSLDLKYPDETVVHVPLDADGNYRYLLPGARRDDLAMTPGFLIARDAAGNELARRPVASVAYWRAQG
ncbi:MAG: hypothetical protein ABI572_11005 [Actinomycetota bacterium]